VTLENLPLIAIVALLVSVALVTWWWRVDAPEEDE